MNGFSMRARVKRGAAGAGVCLAVLGAGVGLAGQAQAAPSAGAAKPAILAGVSCVRPSWCMAVGTTFGAHGVTQNLSEIWNGTAWHLVASPSGSGLGGVSCSATWYCLALGTQGGQTPAFRWNGSKWLKIAEPRGAAGPPSCARRSMCVVANSYAESVLTWNGSRWTNTQLCGGGPSSRCITSTSCVSASLCMAVGWGLNEIYNSNDSAHLWDGKQWSNSLLPNAEDEGDDSALYDVSCAGQNCLALGSSDFEWDNVAKTWQDVTPTNGVNTTARAVSCSSGTDCMAVGAADNAWWHAGTWTSTNFAPARPEFRLRGGVLQERKLPGRRL